MKITIIQTITKTFDEARNLLATRLNEAYLLEPDSGKVLKHKITGKVFLKGLCVNNELQIKDYEEVDELKN